MKISLLSSVVFSFKHFVIALTLLTTIFTQSLTSLVFFVEEIPSLECFLQPPLLSMSTDDIHTIDKTFSLYLHALLYVRALTLVVIVKTCLHSSRLFSFFVSCNHAPEARVFIFPQTYHYFASPTMEYNFIKS